MGKEEGLEVSGKGLQKSGNGKVGRKQVKVQISRTEVWPKIKIIALQ